MVMTVGSRVALPSIAGHARLGIAATEEEYLQYSTKAVS